MIPAHELRIGNYVRRNNFRPDDLFKIRSICEDRVHPINVMEIDINKNTIYASECTLSELEPIRLTNEILEKFEFSNMGAWMGRKENVQIFDERVEFVFEFMDNILTVFASDQRVRLLHNPAVHELQNLYYILTGDKLVLKNK